MRYEPLGRGIRPRFSGGVSNVWLNLIKGIVRKNSDGMTDFGPFSRIYSRVSKAGRSDAMKVKTKVRAGGEGGFPGF